MIEICDKCSHPQHGVRRCGYILSEDVDDTVGFFAPPSSETITIAVGTCKCEEPYQPDTQAPNPDIG